LLENNNVAASLISLTCPLSILLLLFQGYFQRILSIKSTSIATTLSIASMFGCLILAVPSALIGVVARATDWSSVPGYNKTFSTDDGNVALPMVLRYLTPQWVSFVGRFSFIFLEITSSLIIKRIFEFTFHKYIHLVKGLGAISAAVMSSADSSILASSSMFTRNVYKLTIRPKVSKIYAD